MIISHDFGISLEEYAARGKSNAFPTFNTCPNCKCVSQGNLERNGYYWRYGISEDRTLRIPICRLKCLGCRVSFSILPDLLISYFQHTIQTVLNRIKQFIEKKKSNGSRQLLRFYLIRFSRKLQWIHSFFIDIGFKGGMSPDKNKETIKYLKMILDFGESTFLRRSWGHLSKYFMAN